MTNDSIRVQLKVDNHGNKFISIDDLIAVKYSQLSFAENELDDNNNDIEKYNKLKGTIEVIKFDLNEFLRIKKS